MKRALDNSAVAPFALFIEPHQHTFSLKVPRQFCFDQPRDESYNQAKRLFFPSLRVLPEFFNIRNLAMNQELLDITSVKSFSLGVQFKMKDISLPNDASRPSFTFTTTNTKSIIKQLNQVAQDLKQPWQYFPPFLVDFISAQATTNQSSQKNFILTRALSREWYGMDVADESIHKQTLFDTIGFPASNPYPLPEQTVFSNIRCRLLVPPYTTLTLSNLNPFRALGFEEGQEHIEKKYNQVVINNEHQGTYLSIVATRPPYTYADSDPVPKAPKTFFNMTHRFDDEQLHIFHNLVEKEFKGDSLLDSDEFADIVYKALNSLQVLMNLNIALDKSTKTFEFPIETTQMPILRLVVSEIVSHVLGYGPTSIIDADTEKDKTGGSSTTLKQSYEESAFILSFDTGIIYISSNYKGGSMMVESHESFIAELKPFPEGILSLASTTQEPNFWYVSEDMSGSDTVTLEFYLWTFNNHNERIPFDWPCKARIVGVLKSML